MKYKTIKEIQNKLRMFKCPDKFCNHDIGGKHYILHSVIIEKFRKQDREAIMEIIESIKTEYPDLESDDYDNGNLNFKTQLLSKIKEL